MLLKHGANVDGMNSRGNTALTTILNDYCDSTKGMFMIEISVTEFCLLLCVYCLVLTYLFYQPLLIEIEISYC